MCQAGRREDNSPGTWTHRVGHRPRARPQVYRNFVVRQRFKVRPAHVVQKSDFNHTQQKICDARVAGAHCSGAAATLIFVRVNHVCCIPAVRSTRAPQQHVRLASCPDANVQRRDDCVPRRYSHHGMGHPSCVLTSNNVHIHPPLNVTAVNGITTGRTASARRGVSHSSTTFCITYSSHGHTRVHACKMLQDRVGVSKFAWTREREWCTRCVSLRTGGWPSKVSVRAIPTCFKQLTVRYCTTTTTHSNSNYDHHHQQ